MNVSNETKVGVLAAISIAMLVLGFNFMKGDSLFSKTNTYYAVYDQVDHLFRSNPIELNGYKIGQVSEVDLDVATKKIWVTLKIPKKIKIPAHSIFKITNTDMLGSKGIELILGQDSSQMFKDSLLYPNWKELSSKYENWKMIYAQSEDTLSSDKDKGFERVISDVITPIADKVGTVLTKMDTALKDVSLQETLLQLAEAIKSFKNTSEQLNALLAANTNAVSSTINNLNSVSATLSKSSPIVDEILIALKVAVDEIKGLDYNGMGNVLNNTVVEIQKTLKSIQEGQGTLGKLMQDDAFYKNINNASLSIDSLTKDMQRYPRRYFGITEKQRKKGDLQKEVAENLELPKKVK